jgi:predicted component of type VI protein secretion system
MIKAKLVVVGGAQDAEIELKRLPTTIGRARESTITLPHNLVSRRHCEIFEHNGQLYVQDLNSLNGTYLNNEKIAGKQVLLPNQLLTLGNVTFRAVYEDNADSEMPNMPPNAELEPADSLTDDGQLGETINSRVEGPAYSAYEPPTDGNDINAIPVDEQDTEHAVETVRRVDLAQTADQESNVLVIGDEPLSREKSIALSAIDRLPQENRESSFAGEIELDPRDRPAAQVEAERFRIDTGCDRLENEAVDSASLDSFLRRSPK